MAKNGTKRYLIVAHEDSDKLRLIDPIVPGIVPLIVDFDPSNRLGSATLRKVHSRIWATLQPDFESTRFWGTPSARLGLSEGEILDDGVTLKNGRVAVVSVISSEVWPDESEKKEELWKP